MYKGSVLFSAEDQFHFPGGIRNDPALGLNPFARFNEACEFLGLNCGYCRQRWVADGAVGVSRTCCRECGLMENRRKKLTKEAKEAIKHGGTL